MQENSGRPGQFGYVMMTYIVSATISGTVCRNGIIIPNQPDFSRVHWKTWEDLGRRLSDGHISTNIGKYIFIAAEQLI